MASVVVMMLMIMVMMRLLASVAVTMMRLFVFMAMAVMRFLVLVAMAMMRLFIFMAMAVMRFFLVAMAMMRLFVFMAMAVMRFFFLVAVMRFFLRSCRADRCRAIEVRHIMVMIFMGFIQNDIEITARNAGFLDTGNLHHEAVRGDGIQRAFQRFGVCAEVDHRRDEHISADTGGSFKV